MARGQRTSLASLAGAVGEHSPVDQFTAMPMPPRSMPLTDLSANPRNNRDVGDLSDLASIADIQLQPALVITKQAYLNLYPDDVIPTRYVVINGCRRLAAAHEFGRTDLDVTVNDAVARDRLTLLVSTITENIGRKDYDVIEEANAVEALVAECGRADEAAARLHKSEGWVSQRRSLLQLDPELQQALRRGELALRDARSLARVPLEHQVARWRAALDKKEGQAGEDSGNAAERPPSRSRVITAALNEFTTKPHVLADVLRTYLGDEGIMKLMTALST